jgi:hypothetical protein
MFFNLFFDYKLSCWGEFKLRLLLINWSNMEYFFLAIITLSFGYWILNVPCNSDNVYDECHYMMTYMLSNQRSMFTGLDLLVRVVVICFFAILVSLSLWSDRLHIIFESYWVVAFNAAFNNISVVSLRSVNVMETRVPEKHRPEANHWQT